MTVIHHTPLHKHLLRSFIQYNSTLGGKQLFPLLFIAFLWSSKWSHLRTSHHTKQSKLIDLLLRLLYYITFMTPVINLCKRSRMQNITTLYLIVAVLYLPSYLDGSEYTGGRNILWFKKLRLWGSLSRSYFNLKLVRTQALDSQQQYIFGLHPHAIGPYGSILNIHTDANKFTQLFPNLQIKSLAASILFYVPIVRDLWLALGFIDASRTSAMYVLQHNRQLQTPHHTHTHIQPRERSSSADIRIQNGKLNDNATKSTHTRKPTTHYDEKGVYVDPMSLPACTTFSATALTHTDLGVTINALPKKEHSPRSHSPTSQTGSPQRQHSPEPTHSNNTGGSQVFDPKSAKIPPSPLLLPSSRSGNFIKIANSPTVQYTHTGSNGANTPIDNRLRQRTNSTATTIQSSPSFNSLRSLSNSSNKDFSPASSPRHLNGTNSSTNVSVSGSTSTSNLNSNNSSMTSPKHIVRRTQTNNLGTIPQYSTDVLSTKSNDTVTNSVTVQNDDYNHNVQSIAVFVGGKKECLLTNPPRSKQQTATVVYTLYLRKRKGFIRLALQTGSHLVPVFTFGDSLAHTQLMYADLSEAKKLKPNNIPTPQKNVHKQSYDENDTVETQLSRSPSFIIKSLRTLNQIWYNIFGVPIPIVRNIIPHRCNITTVVGKPIYVKYTPHPTDKDIDELHKLYIDELTKLFYENRDKYKSATGSSSILRII